MLDGSSWIVFLVAAAVLLVTPGPSVLYIVTRTIDQGRRAGLASVAGIGVGTLLHVLAATLGVSALVASSAVAFGIVKYVGAAYLVWMGIRRMLTSEAVAPRLEHAPAGSWGTARQGVLVNLLNPKTALFFLAFLPQFVDPRAPVAPQLLTLGLVFTGMGLVSDACYALVAGGVRRGVQRRPSLIRARRYLSGGVYVVLGVSAALARRAT